jgi:hypothetical protein
VEEENSLLDGHEITMIDRDNIAGDMFVFLHCSSSLEESVILFTLFLLFLCRIWDIFLLLFGFDHLVRGPTYDSLSMILSLSIFSAGGRGFRK